MPNVTIDTPQIIVPETIKHERVIKWCAGHWSEMMFALRDRGLGADIAQDADALNEKFMKGESDPCWDATQRINMGAFDIFGPDKIVTENNGCPVCAFANIVQHAADLTAINYNKVQ